MTKLDAVFLSASVPDPIKEPEYAATAHVPAISAAVSALVFVVLGRRHLIWGGHPAITPMIALAAEQLGVSYSRSVTVYQSRYFEDELPEANAQFPNVILTASVNKDRKESLALMRDEMLRKNQYLAGVFIGGMTGIIDEFRLFREWQPNATTVPVFSTGGAVLELAQETEDPDNELRSNFDYVDLFHKKLDIRIDEPRERISRG